MTEATAAEEIRAHAITVPRAVRHHRRQVAGWALASGRPVRRDALAAVIGARAENLVDPCGVSDATVWTADDVGSLLWGGITSWCAEGSAKAPEPAEAASTLDTYLRYLSANRLLAPGSDPVAALRRAITDYGGGRSRSHPAVRHRLAAPVVPIA